MAKRNSQFPDGAADIARRFGVTIKALRIYEDLGLLTPLRDRNGWRSYGRAQCERIAQIVAFKELGLPLASIAQLLKDGGEGLRATLAMQEEALLEHQVRTAKALKVVRQARARVENGEVLDADDLAALVKQTKGGTLRWTPALARLADDLFSQEFRRRLAEKPAAFWRAWADVYEDLARAQAVGDPRMPAARDVGRRAYQLITEMTGGDPAAWMTLGDFWRKGLAAPETAGALPITAAQWTFLGQIFGVLQAAGEGAQ